MASILAKKVHSISLPVSISLPPSLFSPTYPFHLPLSSSLLSPLSLSLRCSLLGKCRISYLKSYAASTHTCTTCTPMCHAYTHTQTHTQRQAQAIFRLHKSNNKVLITFRPLYTLISFCFCFCLRRARRASKLVSDSFAFGYSQFAFTIYEYISCECT